MGMKKVSKKAMNLDWLRSSSLPENLKNPMWGSDRKKLVSIPDENQQL